MQKEYEATFLEIDEGAVKNQLTAMGAQLRKPRQLMKRVIFESDTLRAQHSWVRLRDEGRSITLTLKQVTSDATINGTNELEFVVSDLQKADEFLKRIGLERKNYQENYREEWVLGDIKYDIDTWPDIPTFLEIEGPDEASVREAAGKLGFNYTEAWFGSIDIIYLKKYGRDILKETNLLFKGQG
jgi:adenylate cyclase, class 2